MFFAIYANRVAAMQKPIAASTTNQLKRYRRHPFVYREGFKINRLDRTASAISLLRPRSCFNFGRIQSMLFKPFSACLEQGVFVDWFAVVIVAS